MDITYSLGEVRVGHGDLDVLDNAGLDALDSLAAAVGDFQAGNDLKVQTAFLNIMKYFKEKLAVGTIVISEDHENIVFMLGLTMSRAVFYPIVCNLNSLYRISCL